MLFRSLLRWVHTAMLAFNGSLKFLCLEKSRLLTFKNPQTKPYHTTQQCSVSTCGQLQNKWWEQNSDLKLKFEFELSRSSFGSGSTSWSHVYINCDDKVYLWIKEQGPDFQPVQIAVGPVNPTEINWFMPLITKKLFA